jgi:anion-transporting  ArsA/GET3 family ATPase
VSLLDRRLLFVTGKGGVGKTTVAAALGLLAAERGRRVLVCEVESRGGLSAAYGCGPTAYLPREVAPRLAAMSMDTEASLREYLRIHLRVPTVGRIGPVAQAFDFVATAAPGVREILTVGKLTYEVRENHYDLVIVDASASGHIVGELAAPVGINDLVKIGAIRAQTAWMLDILTDATTTGVVVVTTPEEMPINEAIDLASRLRSETGVALAGVIANRVLPELFGRSEEELFEQIATAGGRPLAEAGGLAPRGLAAVLAAARLAVQRRRSGAAHLERLAAAVGPEPPLAYLPYLFAEAAGLAVTRAIAAALGEEIGE